MLSPWPGLTHGLQPSGELGVFADEGDYVAESLAGGWGWIVDEFEDGQSASSFFSMASRRFSLSSISTVGRQLSIASQRRQRGSDEKYSDLLIE